jgi:hypothetical protein
MEDWLRISGFACRGGTRPNFVSLRGGKYNVPDSSMGIVFVKLGRAIHGGRPSFLCQTAADQMILYLDIDKADPSDISEWAVLVTDEIPNVWDIADVTESLGSESPTIPIVVASKPSGSGLHIHVPCIVAMKSVLAGFARSVAERNSLRKTPLKGDVDRGVYNSGLRMIGCHKRVVSDGFYRVAKIGSWTCGSITWRDETPPNTAEDWTRCIRMCSIIPLGGSRRACTRLSVPSLSPNLGGTAATCSTCSVTIDIPETTIDIARASLPDEFRLAPISSVKKMSDTSIIVGLKSKRCLNLDASIRDGKHTSNHVYIVISPEGVYQKCHNTSDSLEGRLTGPCSSFRSRMFPLSVRAQSLLFPKKCENIAKRALSVTTGRRASASEFVRQNRRKIGG